MELRKEYFLKNGMPCNENGMFYEEYVTWLENKLDKLQNTIQNSSLTKSCFTCKYGTSQYGGCEACLQPSYLNYEKA